ncbi:trypsin-like peptidase domain-containing protein [Leucobacter sp. HY1908]
MATTPENNTPATPASNNAAGAAAPEPTSYPAPAAPQPQVAPHEQVTTQLPHAAPVAPTHTVPAPAVSAPAVPTAPLAPRVPVAQHRAQWPAAAQATTPLPNLPAPQVPGFQQQQQQQQPNASYQQAPGSSFAAPVATREAAPVDGSGSAQGHSGNSGNGNNGDGGDYNGHHSAQPKGRTGMLLAGLAIGALLGGVVGGGVAAVVSANGTQQVVAQGASGTLTLNNAETATAISGVAAVATPSVVTLEVAGASASGSGSGVIYSEDGYIVTNAHVVTLDGAASDNAKIRVKLSDGRILDGKLVGVDPYADLAVVKVEATGLPAIKVADSSKLNVGDLTVAIGAPLNLANTVTSGVVSSLYRGISVGSPLIPQDPATPQDGQDGQGDQGGQGEQDGGDSYGFPWDFRFGLPDQGQDGGQQQQQQRTGTVTLPVVQTDASINPGNSGGALLNGKGELIGINVAIASPTSSDGVAGSAGLGFAIPSNLAARVADSIIAGEQPSHGLLGASVADSSQDTDEDANHAGGLLVDVMKGGAADKAGLRAGDVVTAVNGVPAVDGTSVSALVRMNAGGSTVTIDYTRGGKAAQTEAKLGELEW